MQYCASSTDLWIFGGKATAGGTYYKQDLWKFSFQDKTWVWESGVQTNGGGGVYPTLGSYSSSALPAARDAGMMWFVDDRIYLFGGYGYGQNFMSLLLS